MLANHKVMGSILSEAVLRFVIMYEFTRVFTQKSTGKTRVQNTRGTQEMELTESRV